MSKSEHVINWLDKAMAFSFYALIFFLPISIALVEWFSYLAIFFYLIKRAVIFGAVLKTENFSLKEKIIFLLKSFKPVSTYLDKALALFIFINFISLVMSQNHHLSLAGFFGKVVQKVFVYFAFIECIKNKDRLKTFSSVFVMSFLLISVNGIFQYFTGEEFIHGQPIADGRIASTFRASNDFGGYLAFGLPILSALLLCNFKHTFSLINEAVSRYILILALILSFVCLGLSFSRGAWLGALVGLLILSSRSKRFLLGVIIFNVVFMTIFSAIMLKERQYLSKRHLLLSPFGRNTFWKEAVNVIKDYPVFGTGINTYSVVAREYSQGWGGYPHNCFLQMTAETGIVGLSAFLYFLYTLFYGGIKSYKNSRDSFLSVLLLGAMGGVAGFLFHSFFDTLFYSVRLGNLMWLGFAIIVVAQRLESNVQR